MGRRLESKLEGCYAMKFFAKRRVPCFVAFVLFFVSTTVFGQNFVDPNDGVYFDLERWSLLRLTGPLPSLKPYTIQTIVVALENVLANPNTPTEDQRQAQKYRSRVGDGFHAGLGSELRASNSGSDPFGFVAFEAEASAMIIDEISAALDIKLYGLNRDGGLQLPQFKGLKEDYIEDWSDLGDGILIRQIAHTLVGIGKTGESFEASLGFTRNSFGPFYQNGIVLGPQAPVAGRFSINLRQPGFDYTFALIEITGQYNDLSSLVGNKRLFLHELNGHISPWFELGIFETVVTGGQLNALYLLPLAAYFQLQGVGGFADNSLLGLTAKLKPTPGLDINAVLYLDDLHFNDIAQFEFDTKWKMAFQLGASFSPSDEIVSQVLKRIDFDYTAVMPYMYTHINSLGSAADAINYENYTHNGLNLGPALEPNSERWNLNTNMLIFTNPSYGRLELNIGFVLVRHGNASAGIIPGGTGDIFDDGYLAGVPTFQRPFVDPTGQPYTRFLTQAVLETTLQCQLGLVYELGSSDPNDRAAGRIRLAFDYTFEQQWNTDFALGSDRSLHYLGFGISWLY